MAKRLITEADVRALPTGGVLSVGGDVIATPAALDLAHARGLRVRFADGTTVAGPGAKSGKDCLWHRLLASDGNYVVEVRGGRATVHRLTASGPELFGTDSLEEHS